MSDPTLALANWRVLVTRPAEQAHALADAVREAGATAVLYPTIELQPPPSWQLFDVAIETLSSYAWVVFTSPSAVRFAFGHRPALANLLRAAGSLSVAAVGNQTARALQDHGVSVALVPDDQRQEGLVASLGDLAPGTRILFPQAIGGRELLRDVLTSVGAVVDVVPISRTVAVPLTAPPPLFDAAIFASPSALKAFVAGLTAAPLLDKVVAAMGPTTRATALALGVSVNVMPASPSVAALVAALGAYASRTRAPAFDRGTF